MVSFCFHIPKGTFPGGAQLEGRWLLCLGALVGASGAEGRARISTFTAARLMAGVLLKSFF